MCVYKIDTVWD